VNEGVPEWPPSPYRLVRAIYDAWKRKRPEWPQSRVEPLLSAMASEPPLFSLPDVGSSHTRSFLSQNLKDVTKRQLIFDAFVLMKKGDCVLLGWPNINLDAKQKTELDELLSLINYLGRSESWVSAKIDSEDKEIGWNCAPVQSHSSEDCETANVACPIPYREYSASSYSPGQLSIKGEPKVVSWMEALAWSTSEMLDYRQSEPPALRYQTYMLPAQCFNSRPSSRKAAQGPEINGILYSMESKVLPNVTATIEISDRFRRKLMGIHKKIAGDPRKVSKRFSGKEDDGSPAKGHRHIYVLPKDMDRDGLLDHILVICKESLSLEEQLALDRMNSIWQPNGRPDIQLVPVQWGRIGDLEGTEPRTNFTSATPFLPPRHYRKGRGDFIDWIADEICKEAKNHGLPKPIDIKPISKLEGKGRSFRWLEFRRNRKNDSSQIGYGFRIIFSEPVKGPIALGYGAHFGLGLFVPESS